MKPSFEELDSRDTRMGELSLRRRRIRPLNDIEVYEIKLGHEYLMSSLFHDAEVALTDIGLGELSGDGWDVVVGGLGLGYTAAAALAFKQIERLIVVEALEPVIGWHKRGLVPQEIQLNADNRCVFCHADFFAMARETGFDPTVPGFQFVGMPVLASKAAKSFRGYSSLFIYWKPPPTYRVDPRIARSLTVPKTVDSQIGVVPLAGS